MTEQTSILLSHLDLALVRNCMLIYKSINSNYLYLKVNETGLDPKGVDQVKNNLDSSKHLIKDSVTSLQILLDNGILNESAINYFNNIQKVYYKLNDYVNKYLFLLDNMTQSYLTEFNAFEDELNNDIYNLTQSTLET